MKLLLDTHSLYWFIEGDPQLTPQARTAVSDPTNDIVLSPASYWEIAIKISLGKWQLNRPYEEFLDIGLNQYGFVILPIQPAHTARQNVNGENHANDDGSGKHADDSARIARPTDAGR